MQKCGMCPFAHIGPKLVKPFLELQKTSLCGVQTVLQSYHITPTEIMTFLSHQLICQQKYLVAHVINFSSSCTATWFLSAPGAGQRSVQKIKFFTMGFVVISSHPQTVMPAIPGTHMLVTMFLSTHISFIVLPLAVMC